MGTSSQLQRLSRDGIRSDFVVLQGVSPRLNWRHPKLKLHWFSPRDSVPAAVEVGEEQLFQRRFTFGGIFCAAPLASMTRRKTGASWDCRHFSGRPSQSVSRACQRPRRRRPDRRSAGKRPGGRRYRAKRESSWSVHRPSAWLRHHLRQTHSDAPSPPNVDQKLRARATPTAGGWNMLTQMLFAAQRWNRLYKVSWSP